MAELTTSDSFIVRIYRVDTMNPGNITGLVESMDGRGEITSFTTGDELAAILYRGVEKRKTRRNLASKRALPS